ncbi:MAG: hypothetical protein D6701_09775 [Gemmatimonadetes bacterium]|nr:MAG: hypothetical protein D6701_09775 [Gemmatimonadota bacterium]
MSERPRLRGGRLALTTAALLLGGLLLGRLATTAAVEILWFRAVGYESTMWRRVLWSWGLRGAAMVLVTLVVLVNLRLVARTLGRIQIRRRFGNLEILEQLPARTINLGALAASVLLGLWFGASIPRTLGLQLLFLRASPGWGLADPVLGHDVAYYVFVLPLLGALVTFGMVLAFLVFTLCTAGYTATGTLQWRKGQVWIEAGPRQHLAILVAAFLVLMGVRFWLARSILLIDGSSDVLGIFGYTDANARMVALRVMAVLSLFAAIGTVWTGRTGRALPMLTGMGGVILGGILVGQVYPGIVQRFQVQPNELAREAPYIEHNLEFTRRAFGLHRLRRETLALETSRDAPLDLARAAAQLDRLPVWSRSALLSTFDQVEARFPYYDFRWVAFDRYDGPDGPVPIALSVREVDPTGIQDPNWQNLHLRHRYVSGMGAVAAAAHRATPGGRPRMLLEAIPPTFVGGKDAPEGLRLTRSDIFVGSRAQPYALVHPADTALRRAAGREPEPGRDFPHGIRTSSLLRKLALAWHFRDANLLFAGEVDADTRFVFRRDARDRARAVSGDLIRFPEPAYPVVDEGRIVWVLEGYTATRWFPLSSEYRFGGRRARYVRNSVKATVDAVSGAVALYLADPEDPLAATYARAFPQLFRPLDDMPASLRAHLRYPRALLELQADVLERYHQETAPTFHGQQDVWDAPRELAEGLDPVEYQAEYGIFALPGETDPSFVVATALVPSGRQNLAALLVGRSDGDRYGELTLYEVPVDDQAAGPRQVEALVEQDPVISQQLSLWRSGGSQVWTGHLHIVPVGGRLLYMEPVFLAAEADAIPELRRFVVSDGRQVVMEPTLAGALRALAEAGGDGGGERRPTPAGAGADAPPRDPSTWPAEALSLLDEAEARLRAGDYAGFGEALQRLRAVLARASGGG